MADFLIVMGAGPEPARLFEAGLRVAAGQGFGAFKPALADVVVDRLAPITGEMNRLMADPAHIDGVLRDGSARARAIAAPILRETYEAVGFIRG